MPKKKKSSPPSSSTSKIIADTDRSMESAALVQQVALNRQLGDSYRTLTARYKTLLDQNSVLQKKSDEQAKTVKEALAILEEKNQQEKKDNPEARYMSSFASPGKRRQST